MITIDGESLTLEQFDQVAEGRQEVAWSADARRRVEAARALVERMIVEGRVVYGVTTGFGKLSDRTIPKADLERLQLNLIRSHASAFIPCDSC